MGGKKEEEGADRWRLAGVNAAGLGVGGGSWPVTDPCRLLPFRLLFFTFFFVVLVLPLERYTETRGCCLLFARCSSSTLCRSM